MLVHLNNGKAINIQDIKSVECKTQNEEYFVLINKYQQTPHSTPITVKFDCPKKANDYILQQFRMPIFFK